MTQVTRTRGGDRGAAGIEQAGITFLVAVLLGAAIASPATNIIGPNVAFAICRAFAALPGGSAQCVSPEAQAQDRTKEYENKCTLRQVDRANSYGGNFEIFTAEKGTNDQIKNSADGSSSVTLGERAEAGVGAKVKLRKPGSSKGGSSGAKDGDSPSSIDVKGKAEATVGTSLKYTYNFPEEYGGGDAADSFLDDKRGGWKQYAQTAIPGAQTIDEGVTRAKDGVADLWSWGYHKVTGQEESAESKAARDREHRMGQADSVTADLSLQGMAGLDITSGLVDGGAEISASVSGQVTASLTNDGPDRGSNSFTGIVKWDGKLEATLGMPGDPTRQIGDLPPFLNVSPGMGGTGSYTVNFDQDGNPTTITFTTEKRESLKAGLTPPEIKGVSGKARAQTGTVEEEKRILDLTDPTNRDLYDALFLTGGVSLPNGTVAKVAVPRPINANSLQSTADWMADARALWGQTDQDGIIINSTYDTYGTDLSAKVASEDGLAVGPVGVSWSDTETIKTLTGATIQDMRTGQPATVMANCEG
ncbi:MAG: hypothetical protein Q4P07_09930 [Ornithinimicrobium sp.]|uniref:hypothetical protein n=1 Tax=Ornithinimicrobium sp. TaxID=1977084 RepID=UPI0026DF13BE|nr:hypothetical protein [Ornithinimicrobium sp.]MDO5740454.1 hypothetical protein [Ornithinimicrobium sp.]